MVVKKALIKVWLNWGMVKRNKFVSLKNGKGNSFFW